MTLINLSENLLFLPLKKKEKNQKTGLSLDLLAYFLAFGCSLWACESTGPFPHMREKMCGRVYCRFWLNNWAKVKGYNRFWLLSLRLEHTVGLGRSHNSII